MAGKIGESLTRLLRHSKMYENYNQTPTETASGFGDNFKVLFRWKGSIYRLVWKEFIIYIILYVVITAVYYFVLEEQNQTHFEELAVYCTQFASSLQIVLLLGFFTSTAMQRWFALVNNVPGTTKVTALFVHSLKENQPEGIQIVQQYARWILLSWTLVFRLVCPSLKKAYPDLISLQKEGLLLEHERLQLEMESEKSHPRVVINWNLALLRICGRRNMFYYASDYVKNVDYLMVFKKSCNNTIKFSTKNIPPPLIQVVSIAVYSYGLATLMARIPNASTDAMGWLNTEVSKLFGFFPLFNIIQFFLFYSWLKFGRIACNPFGEDKDDIDVKQLLYCHIEDAFQVQALYVKSSSIEKVGMTSVRHPPFLWTDQAMSVEQKRKRETLEELLSQ